MDKNSNLHNAKRNKKDEFYTQLSDIESELKHYKEHFRDKVVFCNCDDPYESNFFKYFVLNFNTLGLKKLITTGYSTSPVIGQEINLFEDEMETPKKQPYAVIINKVDIGDNQINLADVKSLLKIKKNTRRKLYGDEQYPAGDFRSKECIELLKEADIVVTNPPFSLFREYVAQLIEYNKKFIVIGHQNAITYKEIFLLIKDNKIWLGFGFKGSAGYFYSVYEDIAKAGQHKEGLIRVSGVNWFTNLDIKKRHENLILYKKYNQEEYPKYDNYNAINVDKTKNIPCDYDGVMGVPITFLDKYNPEQFEIIGLGTSRELYIPTKHYINPRKHFKDGRIVSANEINSTLAYKINKEDVKNVYYVADNVDYYLFQPYARILIKKKKVEVL